MNFDAFRDVQIYGSRKALAKKFISQYFSHLYGRLLKWWQMYRSRSMCLCLRVCGQALRGRYVHIKDKYTWYMCTSMHLCTRTVTILSIYCPFNVLRDSRRQIKRVILVKLGNIYVILVRRYLLVWIVDQTVFVCNQMLTQFISPHDQTILPVFYLISNFFFQTTE